MRHFNPRAPCGARPASLTASPSCSRFQSTRPVWGATHLARDIPHGEAISIHAPRVGRDRRRAHRLFWRHDFNPRAPCGARLGNPQLSDTVLAFQSTRPVWGATSPIVLRRVRAGISIHAPRVGRDRWSSPTAKRRIYFNPRAPCGARRARQDSEEALPIFQSTRPVWGATR